MKKKYLLLIGLLLAGCHQESEKVTQSSDAKAIISKDMSIEDAIALVRKEGLSIKEVHLAIVHEDENIAVDHYIIEPTHRPKDALFLVTHSRVDEGDEVIAEIFWHLDHEHDSKLGKADRKDEHQYLSQIDLRSLVDTSSD